MRPPAQLKGKEVIMMNEGSVTISAVTCEMLSLTYGENGGEIVVYHSLCKYV